MKANKIIQDKGFKLHSDLPYCLPSSGIEHNREDGKGKCIIALFVEDNEDKTDIAISKSDFEYLLMCIPLHVKQTDIYTNYGIDIHSHNMKQLQVKHNFKLHKGNLN